MEAVGGAGHAAPAGSTIEAVKARSTRRKGIPCGVLVAPILPGISDSPDQVEKIVELATEANATYIGGQTLFLRGSVRDIFFEWLREHRPDLVRALRAPVRQGRVPVGRPSAASSSWPPGAPWVAAGHRRTRSGIATAADAGRRRRCNCCPRKNPLQESLF